MSAPIAIIGGGLAGCEAAWQIAERNRRVVLHEMRPHRSTPAHATDRLAELVCSNSLRSDDPEVAVGTLKEELRTLDSLVMRIADSVRVPAGGALAVDRQRFAAQITSAIEGHPHIELRREHLGELPGGSVVLATGPLTSPELASQLQNLFGVEALSFYDGIAPIVDVDSLDPDKYFASSRYDASSEDYLNVPLTRDEYRALIRDLADAESRPHLEEEKTRNFFDGCLPIEEMARRGEDTPRFGPMKPVGLRDPRTGGAPYAVIQLRREDLSGQLYNLVGFQTQLSIPDQQRILRALPGFAGARFARYGSAHRNTFLDSPILLNPDLTARARPSLRVAGQIAGVEGYVESTACGLVAALMAVYPDLGPPPGATVIGGLIRYVTMSRTRPFQPMKANWGVVDEVDSTVKRNEKKSFLAARSREAIRTYRMKLDRLPTPSASPSV